MNPDNTLRNEWEQILSWDSLFDDEGIMRRSKDETIDQLLSAIKNRLPKEQPTIQNNSNPLWKENIGYNEALEDVYKALNIESES